MGILLHKIPVHGISEVLEKGTSGANVGLNDGYNSGGEPETYSSGHSTTTTEQTDCFGADVLNNSNND